MAQLPDAINAKAVIGWDDLRAGDRSSVATLRDLATRLATERSRAIIAHTPAGRFGEAKEVCGALVWLCGPGANFVNGIALPVDGGFSAFSGV